MSDTAASPVWPNRHLHVTFGVLERFNHGFIIYFTETLTPEAIKCVDRYSRIAEISEMRIAEISEMRLNTTISVWLKAIACLSLAFALVFSPPSTSHAASGMHGDHHAAASSLEYTDNAHSNHAMLPSHDEIVSAAESTNGKQSSGQCCSGMCLTVVLNEVNNTFVDQATNDKYHTFYSQADSVEPFGFLRPPQYLI